MNPLFLHLVLRDLPRPQRRQVVEQLLPLAIPAAAGQRLLLAAVTAERQVKRQAQAEERLTNEALEALKARGNGTLTDPEGLARYPTLHAAFLKLSEEERAEFFPGQADGAVRGGRRRQPPEEA